MVKAVQFNAFGIASLQVVEQDAEALTAGSVRVRMKRATLNYRDLLMVKGLYNPKLPLPLIPCSDGVGEVVETATDVNDLAVGDRVCTTMIPDWEDGDCPADVLRTTLGGPAQGTLATERVFPRQALMKVPAVISDDEAACLPVAGLTAWAALAEFGGVTAGSRVLLLGTGGVSIMALGIAKALGATVTITSSSDDKLNRAKNLGADHLVNYRTEPKWAKAVLQANPAGVDTVLEVGGDGTFDQSVKATRNGGTVALIGVLAQSNNPVNLTAVLMKALCVQGILVGSRRMFRDYLAFVAEKRPSYVIDRTYHGLTSVPQAFETMANGEHFGKIIITLDT